ncbi:MAG: hypothetical protein ACI9EF_003818 [Pseudohongiellaceae bacterium]|jgi:hypothetical protein
MSIANKKANKVKKAKKDKLRRAKAKLVRAADAASRKADTQGDEGSGDAVAGGVIPGKPEMKNDWVPVKGKAGRGGQQNRRTEGK